MQYRFFNNRCIYLGKYYISNNLWGSKNGCGYQYIYRKKINDNQLSWSTKWTWKGFRDSIKSYASIVLGWHWGWKIQNTGLPRMLSLIKNINTLWEFEVKKKSGRINVCYDVWFSNKEVINNDNPTEEMMIWLYKDQSIIPIGSLQKKIKLVNVEWELWIGSHPSNQWIVYSFIRTENTFSQSLDINDFIKYLISNCNFRSDKLLSIEAGVEVFEGKGQLNTTNYKISIKES